MSSLFGGDRSKSLTSWMGLTPLRRRLFRAATAHSTANQRSREGSAVSSSGQPLSVLRIYISSQTHSPAHILALQAAQMTRPRVLHLFWHGAGLVPSLRIVVSIMCGSYLPNKLVTNPAVCQQLQALSKTHCTCERYGKHAEGPNFHIG